MNTCLQCGREMAIDAAYCPACGAPASGSVGQATPYAAPRASVGQFARASVAPLPASQTSTKAIVGFVLALIPCAPVALAGFIVSILARGEIKRSNGALTGGGLTIAGITVGLVFGMLGSVGMLAAIAIPNFIKFQARSKQSEVRANLKTLGVQLNEFVQTHPGRLPEKFDDLGGVVEASRYSYYLGETDRVLPTKAELSVVPEGLDVSKAVVIAVGNIDNDPFLDVWTVDRMGHVWHLQDDVNDRESVERL